MEGPLDGIRILDFTRYQQGPFSTVLLSDMGADVLKVEERANGDLGRSLGLQPDGWCAYFEAHNRNKRSITIDLRQPEGKEIVYRLIKEIDVVVDNFRPGVMERLGFDLETLREHNPLIITASATGFGEQGEMARRPSFDIIGQGMGGIMSNQGGGPDESPMTVMGGMADQVGAMVMALGIAGAIVARERQGIGQHVDASLLGSQVALQGLQLTGFMRDGVQAPTPQRRNPVFAYFRGSDGKSLTIGLLDPRWWPALTKALGRDDLTSDPRFAEQKDRLANREALLAELDDAFAQRERDEWLRRLTEADVPAGPVHDYADATVDPQILANEYITTLEHPSLGKVGVVGSPIRMSETPVKPRHTAPELGQHTEETLLALGYAWDDIARLKDCEVI